MLWPGSRSNTKALFVVAITSSTGTRYSSSDSGR